MASAAAIAIAISFGNALIIANAINIVVAIFFGIAIAYQHHQKCHETDLSSAICGLPLVVLLPLLLPLPSPLPLQLSLALPLPISPAIVSPQHHQKCHGMDLLSAICALPQLCNV